MTELGNRLKEARLAKNLSLDDVQNLTKIQKRYLVGIEEGNYESMPGNFYVRAFIKQYCEAVQLDPDEIFETYKNEIPSVLTEDLPTQLSRVKTRKNMAEGNPKVFDVLPKLLIGILIVGLAGIVYIFLQHHARSGTNEAANRGNEQVKLAKSAELEKAKDNSNNQSKKKDSSAADHSNGKQNTQNTQPAAPPPQSLTVVQSAGSNTIYQLQNADKFVVKVVSRGQTWVSIKNNSGRSFFTGMLNANGTQTVDFTNNGNAMLVIGRAVDTDIYVNDQKVEYAVSPNSMVRQNITIQYVPKAK